jgi:hypothetical protein
MTPRYAGAGRWPMARICERPVQAQLREHAREIDALNPGFRRHAPGRLA